MAARYQTPGCVPLCKYLALSNIQLHFDEDMPGSVRMRLKIDGIKPSSSGVKCPCVCRRHPSQAARDNARVKYRSDSRSFQVTADNTGGLDGNYRYDVRELPHAIDHEQTRVEGREGWVHVHLRRRNQALRGRETSEMSAQPSIHSSDKLYWMLSAHRIFPNQYICSFRLKYF